MTSPQVKCLTQLLWAMRLISFRDTCAISRQTGKDEWDNPVRANVYSGECLYEEGGSGYARSIITRTPTVYLPGVPVHVAINDHIEITTEFGREIKGTVATVRDVNLPWRAGLKCTRIEIKQGQGD
jgi:hypothetical protein